MSLPRESACASSSRHLPSVERRRIEKSEGSELLDEAWIAGNVRAHRFPRIDEDFERQPLAASHRRCAFDKRGERISGRWQRRARTLLIAELAQAGEKERPDVASERERRSKWRSVRARSEVDETGGTVLRKCARDVL